MNYLPICLLWFLCPLSVDAPFNTEKKNVQFKSGENITLHLPSIGEIDSVIWSTRTKTILAEINKNNQIILYNKICLLNISSITICNVTSEDEGGYIANIKYKNQSSDQGLKTKNVIYYVTEYSDFCGNITHVETKGQVAHLPVDRFENAISCQWMDNKTEIGKITYNGTKIGEITYNRTEMVRNDSGGRKFIISRNGSLSINDFKEEDQGIYTVIVEKPGAAVCNHTYYVTISNFCGNTTHVETKGQVAHLHLPADRFENAISCQWIRDNKTVIGEITFNGTEMVCNGSGDGKFIISCNGSLSIYDFKAEDQGIYTVIIKKPGAAVCIHIYKVTISSHISSFKIGVIVSFVILAVVILITGVIYYWKQNRGARDNPQPRLEEQLSQQESLMPDVLPQNAEGVKQQESVL